MLNSKERAELEEYRRQERSNRVFGVIVVAVLVVGIGGCVGAAYKADAFIDGGVDITKMVRYYSK